MSGGVGSFRVVGERHGAFRHVCQRIVMGAKLMPKEQKVRAKN